MNAEITLIYQSADIFCMNADNQLVKPVSRGAIAPSEGKTVVLLVRSASCLI